jgi:hypothetical protein
LRQKAEDAAVKDAEALMKEKEAQETGIEAYVYAYPLVMMGQTRRVSTNVAADQGNRAPMGQFAHMRAYPTPELKTVVAPNADTLYSLLWLDVAKEAWIVSVPDMKGRYFMLPLLNGWTVVFAAPGTRTTGTGAQKFAITGPGWTGSLPAGVKEYKSATAMTTRTPSKVEWQARTERRRTATAIAHYPDFQPLPSV